MAIASRKIESIDQEAEAALIELSLRYRNDPVMWVMTMYPWGEEGTPLAKHPGPRRWQLDGLEALRDYCARNARVEHDDLLTVYREATASGRGIGKSAGVGMVSHWFLSTRIGGTCIVTANTEAQLKSRTMAEIKKWVTMGRNSHWFEASAMSVRPAKWFASLIEEQLRIDCSYYYIDAQLWSEENPDAFAGLHSDYGIMVVMDEASGIPQPIYDVTEGFFTEKTDSRFWLTFSNPRRTTGAFYDSFHTKRNGWRLRNIDARTVEGTDKAVYERLVEIHGIDSDVVKVEVLGQFPSEGDRQYIAAPSVSEAMNRRPSYLPTDAVIVGVDVARFGDDRSVITTRRGLDAASTPPQVYKGYSTMQLAERAAQHIRRVQADAVFVDGVGVGGGVVDRLRQLGFNVFDVNFGGSATDKRTYVNKRAEAWARMKDWLSRGVLKYDDELFLDLTMLEYQYDAQHRLKLETKDELKKRGYPSCDMADALALTFSFPVGSREYNGFEARSRSADADYDIYRD